MEQMLLHSSCFDLAVKKENPYHMVFYGGWSAALHCAGQCEVSSNREAAHGRYDVLLKFVRTRRAIIFEFKKSRNQSSLDDDADVALKQIFEKKYYAEMPDFTCTLVGVAFYKKFVSKIATNVVVA